MTVVAVAGGSGGVGRTIVEELQKHSKFVTFILSRSPASANHIQTDYKDVDALSQILESHQVEIVISTINLTSEEIAQSQLNLIKAAEKSSTTKRFIPCEFAFVTSPELATIDPTMKWWIEAAELLRNTNLEFTRWAPGWFMDYWGMPQVHSHLSPWTFAFDMINRKAAIPGDGSNVISLTYSVDMARYLVYSLNVTDWPEWSIVSSDDITFNEFLKLAEEVRGPFEVAYDGIEKLLNREVTTLSIPNGLDSTEEEVHDYNVLFGIMATNGNFELPKEGRLNERMKEVKPLTMKEFLKRAWIDKQ